MEEKRDMTIDIIAIIRITQQDSNAPCLVGACTLTFVLSICLQTASL